MDFRETIDPRREFQLAQAKEVYVDEAKSYRCSRKPGEERGKAAPADASET